MLGKISLIIALSLTAPALAAVGEQHRVASQASAALRDAKHRSELRITIWYPANAGAPTQSIDIPPGAPEFLVGSVAPDGPWATESRYPIILLSHGFGGSARMMGWFGLALAEQGYVVVAVDHPGNNGIDPQTVAGSVLWWNRADDLKLALATVLADPALSAHLDQSRIGVAGFSIGGLTALLAGGARTDPERMLSFCRQHPTDGTCKPQLEFPVTTAESMAALADPALASQRADAGNDHSVPGVRAVFAMAPVVQPLTPKSLKAMQVPVAIVVGREDVTVPPATHARVAESLIPGASLVVVPEVTHYSFLSTCSAKARAMVPVCLHAGEQKKAHEIAIRTALSIFDRTLR